MAIRQIFRLASRGRFAVILAAAAALVGGFLLATSVFGGSPPASPGSEFPLPINPSPSEYLKLTPGDPGFDSFPSGFADFPIYWVGQEFGGYPLRFIIRSVFSPQDGSPSENKVAFLYGSCGAEKLTDGGCPPPLQIIIQPYCLVPPELVGHGSRPANMEKVRGAADAVSAGGGRRIWTGDVTIKIYASSVQLLEDATAAFVSPNGMGPASVGATLPAPAPDCSGYKMVPYPAG